MTLTHRVLLSDMTSLFLSLPCYPEEMSEAGRNMICLLGIRVMLIKKVDQPSIATRWYLGSYAQRYPMITAHRRFNSHVMVPSHKSIVTVVELSMICRFCNGAVSGLQLISASRHSCRQLPRPPAKAQARIVRFPCKAGYWNAVTVSSRLNWQY